MSRQHTFTEALERRILVLDGGFGTMLQTYDLAGAVTSAPGHEGECNDLLSVTRRDIVSDIHRKYLEAGADIIETNSFNTNALSLSDHGLSDRAYEIARAAADVARVAADEFSTPDKPRFVAGSVGPTNRTLSMSGDVNAPAHRDVTFDQMHAAYLPQIRGLIDGGVDLIIIETVFDTLNAKAALAAVRDISPDIPVIVSATISDASGRLLTGQTLEGFCTSVMHAHPIALGLNCGFGAEAMIPFLQRLAAVSPVAVSVHPNAGLPNIDGGYDETPEMFAAHMKTIIDLRLANIVGGCCGTTPQHIRLLNDMVNGTDLTPRKPAMTSPICRVSGLEPLEIRPESNFINIGERANVAGSAKFARLIREGAYDEAISIANAQVEAGAQIVDVCMDAPMIDAQKAMTHFLNLMASEPTVARVPVMIDSSDFSVIEAGLKCTQGKSVVNSISLKEGEDKFRSRALTIMRYGAAVVVMLFDEKGQADVYERKIEVARRSYDILTSIGFPPEDIIFDPNILSIATGMPEHDIYARDFIEATRWIKANLPYAKVSGGVSNLSFAFRGNNTVRKAMHSVFLYHAIAAGMDMAIVNPQMVQIYDDIEPELLLRVEDLVLYRRADAADRLIEYARGIDGTGTATAATAAQWRSLAPAARVAHAMLNGITEHIAADTLEIYETEGDAVKVINDVLMPAMARVGTMFGEGKLFLPQVVKSARVMKLAVAALEPYIQGNADAATANAERTVVLATVKGDVHDIGKNIVGVVLACNGWNVADLGVMVDADKIVSEAIALNAKAICLSGLITPSLVEMTNVVHEAERRNLNIPIIVGGATTSDLYTAVKIAPLYRGTVVRTADAADNAATLAGLVADTDGAYAAEISRRQQQMRDEHAREKEQPVTHATPHTVEACSHCAKHPHRYLIERTIADVEGNINWGFLFSAWGLPGRYPDIFYHPERGTEARKVYEDAQKMLATLKADNSIALKGVIRKVSAHADGDAIIADVDGAQLHLPVYRNTKGESIADYIDGEVTLFAITAGLGLDRLTAQFRENGDEYSAMMAKFLCDRLAEAFAETVLSGGCRIAIGYPSAPDHRLKKVIFDALDVTALTGMTLTESCMITPAESICGLYLTHGKYVE